MTTKRPWLAACLTLTAALASVAVAAGAQGDHDKGPRNPNACLGGVKIEPVRDGAYDRQLNGAPILVTLDVDEASQSYDFTTSSPVTSAVAKGGPGSLTYEFTGGAAEGADLHAPLNPGSGKYYGLSHVCFFADGAPPLLQPPALDPPVTEPPAEEPPAEEPPTQEPPGEEPPGSLSF